MPVTRLTRRAGQNDRPRKLVAGRFAPRHTARLLAVMLLGPLSSGCFTYLPVATPPSTLTGDARLILTEAGTAAIAGQLGQGIREIEGTITRLTADTVVMTVAQTTTVTRERFVQRGTTVAVPRPLVQQIATRTLARKRTVALTGITATVVAIALRASGALGGSGSGDPASGGAIQP